MTILAVIFSLLLTSPAQTECDFSNLKKVELAENYRDLINNNLWVNNLEKRKRFLGYKKVELDANTFQMSFESFCDEITHQKQVYCTKLGDAVDVRYRFIKVKECGIVVEWHERKKKKSTSESKGSWKKKGYLFYRPA